MTAGHLANTGAAMGYDGDGLRAWKQNDAGQRTYFLYDGSDPVCELDAGGNVSAVNTFGATGLLSRRVTSTNASVFYTFDERGNVAQRTDAGANVLSSDLYDGYGKKMAGPSDVWGYGAQAGYYMDGETGLVLCTHRFYDPQTGRFLTRDPMGYGGGINLYGYVGNNPVNGSDPFGLDPNYYKSTFYKDPAHWKGGQPPLPDVPPGFNIDQNIAQADRWGKWGNGFSWIKAVNGGGIWDPKNFKNPKTGKPYGQLYDDAGNFNFGATGKANGWSSCDLYRGAGKVQAEDGPMGWGSHPEWGEPPLASNGFLGSPPYYGDDPPGHWGTNYGIMYYEYWYAPQHGLPANKW